MTLAQSTAAPQDTGAAELIEIDLFQDVVCPWCRIGKAHLEQALARWQGAPVVVRYHPFFLNPGVPEEGYDFLPYMRSRFGASFEPEQIFGRVTQVGADAGLKFNFDRIEKSPNTLKAHRLIALTPDDQKSALIDALYDAYFRDGRDIGNPNVLADIAAETGLDRDQVAVWLAGDKGEAETLAEMQWAADLGITGVPMFVFNGQFALSGAQPVPTLIAALDRAASTPRE